MLRHVVVFRLNESADGPEMVQRLQALVARIPTLLTLDAGTNVREHEAAYDVGLVTTHADLAGLTEYIEHEAHQEFLVWLNPRVLARAVVDHF